MGNNNSAKKKMGSCMKSDSNIQAFQASNLSFEAPEKHATTEKLSSKVNSQNDGVENKANIEQPPTQDIKQSNKNGVVHSIDALRQTDTKKEDTPPPVIQKKELPPLKISDHKKQIPQQQKKASTKDLFALNFGQSKQETSTVSNTFTTQNKVNKIIRPVNLFTGKNEHPQVTEKLKENVGKYALWQCTRICQSCYSKGLATCNLNEKNQKMCECKGKGVVLGKKEPDFYCEICWLAKSNKLLLCNKCGGTGKIGK